MRTWRIGWVRGGERIGFRRPQTFFCLGGRGEGKSTLLEHIGVRYLLNGAVVLDLFGSADGEGLAWLRSPYAKDKRVLLIRGQNVDVKSPWPSKTVEEMTLDDINNNDVIISARPLYLNRDQEFYDSGKLTDLLYQRLSWKRVVFLVVREASNLYYSRLKVSANQLQSKADMIYLLREGRHFGIALALDSLRYYAVDIDVRSLSDYLLLKSQGVHGLASDLEWLYSFFDPSKIRNHEPFFFYIVSRKGSLGQGWFPYHSWHKEEKENIVKNVGLKIEYGEMIEQPKDMGTYKSVGDKEHTEIIDLYIKGVGIMDISEKLGRSSRTPHTHIKKHNEAVDRSGFCAACKRVGSEYLNKKAVRGRNTLENGG